MESNECKLCFKRFCNGRALGGHMRSHYAALPLPPKTPQRAELSDSMGRQTESTTSSPPSSDVEDEKEIATEGKGFPEKPKRSLRFVDPELPESEDESTRNNNPMTRKRSKRGKKSNVGSVNEGDKVGKIGFLQKPSSTESFVTELEPVSSSVSDASPEEDVALCLMMLSRDLWSSDYSVEPRTNSSSKKKYKCEICSKFFTSSQALGSHRTSHYRKMKNSQTPQKMEPKKANYGQDHKLHECPFCGQVFGSGQALGGHKRSHLLSSSSSSSSPPAPAQPVEAAAGGGGGAAASSSTSTKMGENLVGISSTKGQSCLIDLNLPASMEEEEEEINQEEVFVLSQVKSNQIP